MLAACGGNATDQKATDDKKAAPAEAAPADNSSNPDYQKGLALVVASNCTTCHKVNEKLIGPAYQDVAAFMPVALRWSEENGIMNCPLITPTVLGWA